MTVWRQGPWTQTLGKNRLSFDGGSGVYGVVLVMVYGVVVMVLVLVEMMVSRVLAFSRCA